MHLLRYISTCTLLCVMFPFIAFAQSNVDQSVLEELAQSFTWKKLIQAGKNNTGGPLATVLSEGFYLSGASPLSPLAEMQATITAFSTNQMQDETPAACRFPARLLWLEKELPALASGWERPACPELEATLKLDDLDGISLINVSGYFGNPASAFGHLLLQVNRKNSAGVRGLQDTGINFGARVPDGEHIAHYVLKGLLGGYNASFTGQSFYVQDFVYSATEFRDMWAYELNLNEYQQKIILFHLWELREALFKYYFLKVNCAFHLAQMMEIALETDFNLDARPWYLPVTVFHKLNDLDSKQPGSVIKSVRFIPSKQREVHLAYEKMNAEDQRFANRYVVAESPLPLPESASAQLMEFLLLYIDYKAESFPLEEQAAFRERRNPILLARLRAPATSGSTVPEYDLERFAPAAAGPRTGKLGVGVNYNDDTGSGQSIVFAPFSYDVLNANTGSLIDSNFKLGETTIIHNDGEVLLEKFELISLEKLAPPVTSLAGETKWNWRMEIGVKHFPRRCERCLTPMISGGVGRAQWLVPKVNVYGFATAEINRQGIDTGLAAGFLWQVLPRVRMRVESHAQLMSTTDGIADSSLVTTSVAALVNFGPHWDIVGSAETSSDRTEGEVVLNYRW